MVTFYWHIHTVLLQVRVHQLDVHVHVLHVLIMIKFIGYY